MLSKLKRFIRKRCKAVVCAYTHRECDDLENGENCEKKGKNVIFFNLF